MRDIKWILKDEVLRAISYTGIWNGEENFEFQKFIAKEIYSPIILRVNQLGPIRSYTAKKIKA